MIDLTLQISMPTIEPWMISVFTYVIMIFVGVKVLQVLTKSMKIDWKNLLNFKDYSHDRLVRKAAKLKLKSERMADDLKLKDKINEHKTDIERYEKAEKELKE